MTMYSSVLTFFIFILFFSFPPEENYPQIFGDDYSDALAFVEKNQVFALTTFSGDTLQAKKAWAIVFPELIRYSMVRDFFETSALEILYVKNGKEAADFSIGPFQMKPSFVEELEFISKQHYPALAKKICIDGSDKEQNRKVRLERLKTLKGQLQYLKAYISIYIDKESLQKLPPNTQVIYLAHAYNHGIKAKVQGHEANSLLNSNKYFPYGSKYPGKQYSYAAIANYFFKNQPN